jgi:argininosuccinate lyase
VEWTGKFTNENKGFFCMNTKMWDGRFSKPSDEMMEQFNNSLSFDKTLIEEDIAGSIAWASALTRIGVYSESELTTVKNGLLSILDDYKQGKVEFKSQDEDIHMAVERILLEKIGEAASRLHTGRSRNDQVATDTRLYLKKNLQKSIENLVELQRAVIVRAESDSGIIMPGYTHLQQAQPVVMSQYWLSFFFILEREKARLEHAIITTDMMPLGAGAMAGSGFKVDRAKIAEELGFSIISPNSMDAVASRDFTLEALAAFASLGISMSRYAEDLIIWSTKEFSFVELDDAWSTGSSIMPQKKNPDSLELIRGKSGRFVGNYMRFATTLKGIGLTYFKDLQEDKEPLFDSVTHIEMVLKVFTQVLLTLNVNKEKIESNLDPLLLATDLADYLARKGMPFRQAHKVVGKIVAYCVESKKQLNKLNVNELRMYSDLFDNDVVECFSWETAINNRNIYGGTGRESIKEQLRIAKEMVM